MTAYETNTQHDPNNNNAMLGVHASASAIIQYGKIARKQVRLRLRPHRKTDWVLGTGGLEAVSVLPSVETQMKSQRLNRTSLDRTSTPSVSLYDSLGHYRVSYTNFYPEAQDDLNRKWRQCATDELPV